MFSPACPDGYRIELLSTSHRRDSFACGVPELDRYFAVQARQDMSKNLSSTYVLVHTDANDEAVGYFTLSTASIGLYDLPEAVRSKLTKQNSVPAALLGRMAITHSYQGKRLGELLLVHALFKSLEISRAIGVYAVVLDAKGPVVKKFYERYGFRSFNDEALRMFLPIKEIAQLFDTHFQATVRS